MAASSIASFSWSFIAGSCGCGDETPCLLRPSCSRRRRHPGALQPPRGGDSHFAIVRLGHAEPGCRSCSGTSGGSEDGTHFDCFFHVTAKAAGKTAPPLQQAGVSIASIERLREWNRRENVHKETHYEEQPAEIYADCIPNASKDCQTTRKAHLMMWAILISRSGVACGLTYIL